jgi:hypothetical protein
LRGATLIGIWLMALKIGPKDASVYGIPAGVPRLKGFVCESDEKAV